MNKYKDTPLKFSVLLLCCILLCQCSNNNQSKDNDRSDYVQRAREQDSLRIARQQDNLQKESTMSNAQYVDLGLSVKWATCNIGANSPSDYGGLYGWGDVTGEKTSTDLSLYPTSNPPENISATEYDIAYCKLGKGWRMPTDEELTELKTKCKWEWTDINGINGYKVIGKNGNYIFLPASGIRKGNTIVDRGENIYYWSGTGPSHKDFQYGALCMYIRDGSKVWDWYRRSHGLSIRPVKND